MSGHAAGPLGILAGAGSYPLEIAAAVTGRGRPVHVVAIDGFAAPETALYPCERVGLGQLGRMLASFRRAACLELVIAGGLRRPDLTRIKPDWGVIRHLPSILQLTRGGDDSVLRRVVQFFEKQGFVVRGAADVAPELLAGAGPIASRRPDGLQLKAIARAVAALRTLGAFDVGQAAVATPERVVALESVRGTDAMLAALGPGGAADGAARDGVLVKLAKPGQEMRVDLPAIGPTTIEGAVAAGLAGLAVSAGQAIVLERAQLVAQADQAGLFVQGLDMPPLSGDLPSATFVDPYKLTPLSVLARRAPTPWERRDIGIGRQLAVALAKLDLGRAAVVAGEHVLAVSASLDVPTMLALIGRDSQWGRRLFKSQLGTLVLDLGQRSQETPTDLDGLVSLEVFAAAKAARLAGVVCLGAKLPEARRDEIIGWANDARLYLLAEESLHG
ncbi:MAG: LpxI family protein [Hyphomicrobiaceae bacterium]